MDKYNETQTKSFEEILNQNKLCKIDLNIKKIKENPIVHDLLTKMLEVDPEQRIVAKKALEHEFFKSEESFIKFILHEKVN